MVENVPLSSLLIVTGCLSLLVLSVAAVWRWASRYSPPRKPPSSPASTEISELRSQIAALQVDTAELFSVLEKQTTTVKRLSSRQGMRDVRARREGETETPPVGADKATLYRHYGVAGLTGPAFATKQQSLERLSATNHPE